jgi:hypothetical protein
MFRQLPSSCRCDYSTMIRSAHSTSDTKIAGLPNFAPQSFKSASVTPRAREQAPQAKTGMCFRHSLDIETKRPLTQNSRVVGRSVAALPESAATSSRNSFALHLHCARASTSWVICDTVCVVSPKTAVIRGCVKKSARPFLVGVRARVPEMRMLDHA